MKKLMIGFFKDESGQTATEYVLLLGVVAIIVMKFKAIAIPKLEGLVNKVFENNKIISELNNMN